MSKLGCVCGNTIIDQTDNISYKAQFLRDQDYEKYIDYSTDVAAFIESIQNGRREAWIREYFSQDYPTHIDNSSVIFDIVSSHERKMSSTIYQCENCGRIKFQVKDTDTFASFKPEDERYHNIFTGLYSERNDV